jgi:membrane-associated phospholipid phosphatase
MDALYQFGINLIQSIQTLSPALDGMMNGLTFLGQVEFYLVFIPIIYWSIDRRIGVRALLLLIYTEFVAYSFKQLLHQPRPCWIGDVKALSIEPSYGIPSSHASNTLAVMGYLALKIKKNWFWWIVAIILFLIGVSRLYLGVHFPQDVLFGWLIGFTVLWGIAKWELRVRDWLDGKSLSVQIGIGFIDSLLIVLIGFIIRIILNGMPDPASYSSYSADARTVTHFFTVAGTAFGTVSGYALMRQYASFDSKGTRGKRLARYVVGIFGLLLLYLGLDILFASITSDETTLGYFLRYIRYGSVAFWATFLAPWVFLKTKLAEAEIKKFT